MFSLEDLVDAAASGLYLLFAILHFDHHRRRAGGDGHVWLAAAALGALTVDLTGLWMRHHPEGAPVEIATLNLVAVGAASAFLAELAAAFDRRPRRGLRRVLQALAVAAFAVGVPTGSAAVTRIGFAASAALLVGALVSSARMAKKARTGERETLPLALGFTLLLVSLLGDLAMETGILPRVYGLPVAGFAALFLSATLAMNRRAERERRELAALRAELEQRVDDRTAELSEANRKLAEAARTDALTGLLNRRGFFEAAERERARAERSGSAGALLAVDVDRFKAINDAEGHAAGDGVLRAVAEALRSGVRSADLVARWGGEEFLLLLPDVPLEAAARQAEALRKRVESLEAPTRGGRVTVSLGVVGFAAGESLERAAADADDALYAAKAAGKNRVVVAGAARTPSPFGESAPESDVVFPEPPA